jgi:3',5'-cyclic AMP phosphodiesterase CpdA
MKVQVDNWLQVLGVSAAMAAAAIVACDRLSPTTPTPPVDSHAESPSGSSPTGQLGIAAPDVVFAGAGDIAVCGSDAAERTAQLLDRLPGFVFSLGDNVYPHSTVDLLLKCYEPTWGRHRARTFASPGNHDWEVQAGTPYFGYFGAAAGPAGLGYHSFTIGGWHVLSLNSNIAADAASPQYRWAKQDAAANPGACTLAMWHHPVFNSGSYGNDSRMKDVWRMLDATGVDLVITGHEHSYERFAPQDADGRPDPLGIRQFVVGTGGADRRPFVMIQPNSEARSSDTWGVLKLVLRASSYEWEFLPVEGAAFRDAGSSDCVRP